jgi:hypothetical protein
MSISTPLTAPTLPTAPVWVGSSAIQETADSPQISNTKDGIVFTKIFTGPYASLLSSMPSRLSSVTGVPTSYTVDTVLIKNGPGAVGTMTITCCLAPSISTGSGDSTEEVEWVEVQRPLKSHKMFQHDGDKELELTDLAAIQIWQNQTDPVKLAAFQYDDASGTTQTLTANAIYYGKKWLRGQESYNEYAPVCRSTISSPSSPTSGGCGIITTAPGIAHPPADYQWLKNADRVLKRNRTWERVQEWLGAWWWDPDIYDTANTGGSDSGGSDGGTI